MTSTCLDRVGHACGKRLGNFRSVQTPSEAWENFRTNCSLQNLGFIRERNLDPGGLVPSETLEGFWELPDAFGHYGKASQVFERLWKPPEAFGTVAAFGNLNVDPGLLAPSKPFRNLTFGGVWNFL